jgi:hypothetical protein
MWGEKKILTENGKFYVPYSTYAVYLSPNDEVKQ